MKEKIKTGIIIAVVVIILALPIVINYINNHNIKTINYKTFSSQLSTTSFEVVHFGKIDDELEEELIDLRNDYEITIENVNMSELTEDEKKELTETNKAFEGEEVYVIIQSGEVVYATNDTDLENINKQVNKYKNYQIPEDEIAYKTYKNFKDFNSVINSKTITMTVLGRSSCIHCNRFKLVYNEAASDYNINIYYIDSDVFDSTEYSKILKSGINIPAECSTTGEEIPLSDGFGTPLTLFTKKGKVIGCISGEVNRTGLDAKLKSVGMIK